jgi:eukaryotic-like serine/threonine-protein kinase
VAVDDSLVAEACAALGVRELGSLRDGTQKTVRLVERGGERLVLKVASVGSSSPDALRRAQREVELLGTLNHPNVVSVASGLAEIGVPPRGVAWLEEYLDGEDLADLVTAPWSWDQTADMGRQVSLGLGAMHEMRVVHRDLSPHNIRRVKSGAWVVMDPGFARHELRSSLTLGGQPGTLGFASPEHLNAYSGVPTPFSDVFCVGILMFLALTGEQPIAYLGDLSDYLGRLGRAQIQDLAVPRPDLSAEQRALVVRCLHAQPARRHRNGTILAAAIEAVP